MNAGLKTLEFRMKVLDVLSTCESADRVRVLKELGPDALDTLAEVVGPGGDNPLVPQALSAAMAIDPGDERVESMLRKAAKGNEPRSRVAAAALAQNVRMQVAEEVLEELLDDRDLGARKWAIKSALKRRPPGLMKKLEKIADEEENAVLREAVSRGLGRGSGKGKKQ